MKRKRHKIVLISWGLLLILIISIYTFLSYLPNIAQHFIIAKLASAGVEDARLVVRHIGLKSTSLADIQFGKEKDLEIAEITASYSFSELLKGKLAQVTISGLRLRTRIDSRGISYGSLDPLIKNSRGGGTLSPALPVSHIELRSSKIEILTPYGPVEIPVILKAYPIDTGGVNVDVSAEIRSPSASLRAKSTLVAGPEGTLRGDLRFFDGRFDADNVRIENIKGHVTLSGPIWIPTNIDGEITFGNARLAQTHIPVARFDFNVKGDQAHAGFRAHSRKAGTNLQLRAKIQEIYGSTPLLSLRGEIETQESASFQWISPYFGFLKGKGLGQFQIRGKTPPLKRIMDFHSLNLDSSVELNLFDITLPQKVLHIHETTLTLVGNILYRARRWMWMPQRGGEIRLKEIRWKDPAIDLDSLRLKIDGTSAPLLNASLEASSGGILNYQMSLTPFPFRLKVSTPQAGSIRVQTRFSRLRISGRLSGPDLRPEMDLNLSGDEVEIPKYQIALRGLEAQFHSKPSESDSDSLAKLHIEEVLHTKAKPFFKSLRLKASIKKTSSRLHLQSQFTQDNGAFVLDLSGVQNLSSGYGNIQFKLHPITFAPELAQPPELFPVLEGVLTSASGKIALNGTIQWQDRLVSNIQLLAEDLNIETNRMTLKRVNTVLQLNSILPYATPPGQKVSIALLNIGIPLTNGIFTFQLKSNGHLFLNRAEWQMAGGKLFSENESFDLNQTDHQFHIKMEGVDLQEVVQLAKVEGLSATGRLMGRIPVQVQKKRIVIREGLLKGAPGGGLIRYNPEVVPPVFRYGGERARQVLSALKNFRYKSLEIHLDGPSDGEAKIRIHLRGSNPDFFNGRSVEFNLNLSGPLGQILQASTEGYRIPEDIHKKLEKYGR